MLLRKFNEYPTFSVPRRVKLHNIFNEMLVEIMGGGLILLYIYFQ
jgi:hypothetical protein